MSASAVPARRFGPAALATPANYVTAARLVFAIPTLMLIERDGASWLTFSLWLVLACTDGVDGWLARRDGTTRSGAFLDPLADKFMVLGGFVALAVRGDFGWVPVVLVGAREVGISVYRALAGRRGISLPARRLGKLKTFAQLCAVGGVVWPWTADLHDAQQAVLWTAVALTLFSGLDILRRGWVGSRA